MDTSAEINQELRNATVERKKQGGHRCSANSGTVTMRSLLA